MPDPAFHPTPQELTAFGLGKLPDAAAVAIASHLESCAGCRRAVENVPPDSFVGKVRAAKPGGSSFPPAPSPTRGNGTSSVLKNSARSLPPPDGLPPELVNYTKYRFVRELGRGGMGIVYQAEQTLMDRTVAIKVINPSVLEHPDALARFQGEVKAAAKLDHPNIVRAYDAEQVGSLHLLVMQFVEGWNLAEVVQQNGPLAIELACNFVRQAALGLQHAFEQEMVHRDIKPGNLMLTPKGQVKILDFGLARLCGARAKGKGLTQFDSFLGTPEYVSPEQANDPRTADIRADIYSLGCTFYFLLTGRPPFQEDTIVKLVRAHIEKEPPPLRDLRPEVPAELAAVVVRMLAKDPTRRFQKPVEVAQALMPFIQPGSPAVAAKVAAPPPGVASPASGTVTGTDTSKLQKIRKDAARKTVAKKAPAENQAVEPFGNLRDAGLPPQHKKKIRTMTRRVPPPWHRRWPVLAGVVAAVVALVLAGVVFKIMVKTGDGEATLVLEVDPPGAEIVVDGQQKTTVNVPGDNSPIEITVKPGHHKLQITKAGFVATVESRHRTPQITRDGHAADTWDIELAAGKSDLIKVRLEPQKVSPDNTPKVVPTPLEPPNREPGEAGAAPDDKDFVQMFNGKDLKGWKKHPIGKAKWEVKDGVLIGSGDLGHLFYEKQTYENFHLHVEAMINDGGSSGVYFRTAFGPATRQGYPIGGYTARIDCTGPESKARTGSLLVANSIGVSLEESPAKFNDWFTLDVVADGPRLVIEVNGQTTADYVNAALIPRIGQIALQVHDAATVVKFKKIEIKELSPGDTYLQWQHPGGVLEQVKGNVWLERLDDNWRYWREISRTPPGPLSFMELLRSDPENGEERLHIYQFGVWHANNDHGWQQRWPHSRGRWSIVERKPPQPPFPDAQMGKWVPMLNGKDLAGWQAALNANASWKFNGGEVTGRWSGPLLYGLLLTRRADYQNFRLRMETMLAKGDNLYLLLRCGASADRYRGYMARILGNPTGVTGAVDLFAHFTGVPALPHADAVPLKFGEWFPLEVIAEGSHISLQVNGRTVIDHTDANETFTAGRIGLVCNSDNRLARFRNIEIKELPLTMANP